MIPLSVPNLSGNELTYVNHALSDGWVSTGGSSITRFEDEFAVYSGVEYTTACQSGTAALHLALVDAGVGAGHLVAAPTLTFIASINPIRYAGADPVFMDCDDSLCIDPVKFAYYLEKECELRDDGYCYDKSLDKPIRAAIVVHIFGNAADMECMVRLCDKYNIVLIEDAAEAVGTFYNSGPYDKKMAGTIGDYGAYSFNGNKIITTGCGGMLTSPYFERVQHMKHLSTQAKTDEVYYTHDEIGFNYRMTNVQAAIGLAQLEQLEMFIDIKRANYDLYREQGIDLLPFQSNCRPNYWFYSYVRGGVSKSASKSANNSVSDGVSKSASISGSDGVNKSARNSASDGVSNSGGNIASNSGSNNASNIGGNNANKSGGNSASRKSNYSGNNRIRNSRAYRDELIRHLFNRGIQTRPVWGLCHEQPMYWNCRAFNIEKALDFHDRIINLPCSTNLSANDICRVAEEIYAFNKQYK